MNYAKGKMFALAQLSGYKAFIPSPLPPNPAVKMDESIAT